MHSSLTLWFQVTPDYTLKGWLFSKLELHFCKGYFVNTLSCFSSDGSRHRYYPSAHHCCLLNKVICVCMYIYTYIPTYMHIFIHTQSALRRSTLGIQPTAVWKYSEKKISESFKKRWNLLHTIDYLHCIYVVLGVIEYSRHALQYTGWCALGTCKYYAFVYGIQVILDFVITWFLEPIPVHVKGLLYIQRCPCFWKSLLYTTLLLWKTYITTCFHNWKKSKRISTFTKKKGEHQK